MPRPAYPSALRSLAAALAVTAIGCGGSGGADPGASATVGPAGGTVALAGGAAVEIPAGALAAETRITVVATGETAPSGAPIYRLGPDGTTFAAPVAITLPRPAGVAAPAVYWSRPGSATDFDVVPAELTPAGVRAEGEHFSEVFVGPSSGSEVCANAGPGAEGTACGGGRACRAGTCLARIAGAVVGPVVEGIVVVLSGDAGATTTTDAAGAYAFEVAAGEYTVTPTLADHAFTPREATLSIADESVGGVDFEGWRPALASVLPGEGRVGATLTLSGERFGPAGGDGVVTLGGLAMPVVSWSDREIAVQVPSGAAPGPVAVRVGTGRSEERPFVVTAAVQGEIVDASPSAALAGSWAAPARFTVAAAGTGRSAVATSVPGSGYGGLPRAFSLELPLGVHALEIVEHDLDGGATVDLLQAGTRRREGVVVTEAGVSGLALPVRWHWEVHPLDPGFPVCGFERQLHFRDADHGFVTFQVDPGTDPSVTDPRVHGMVMATSDGGRTWSVRSPDVSADLPDFRPTAAGWYPTGSLLALDDGTVLSIGDGGQLVRSADSGATWSAGSLGWASCGPGAPSATRFARAGERLYVSVSSGGVQGSRERSQLLTSTDAGQSWTRLWDVCGEGACAPDGCATGGVPLGFAGLDMACSDVDPRRCVTLGTERDGYSSLVLVTRDAFESFTTIAPSCGYFTDGQVLWLPGTDTVWVVARSSCPGVGYERLVSTDGGATFGPWEPSPLPGHAAFADASNGMAFWDWGVRVTRDGGATWRYTGRAPAGGGALRSVHVLDADRAWVLGRPDCRTSGVAYVARFVP